MLEFLGYLVSPFLLSGALLSLQIAAVSLLGGLAFGLVLALMRLSRYRAVSAVAWVYIWFIRGTPLLLQLVFLYDVIPAIGIKLDPVSTAMVGFALNEAAFAAEIIRGSILSVNRSQSVAAAALGMPPLLAMRRIVLPQAMRALLPGIGNQTISLIKSTSIASVIFVNELTFRAEQIVGQNFQFFKVFTAAGLVYLAMTSAVAILQASSNAISTSCAIPPATKPGRRPSSACAAAAPRSPRRTRRRWTCRRSPTRRGEPAGADPRHLPRHGRAARPGRSSSAATCRKPMATARSCAASTSP